jgi:uncharacterized protein
MGRPMEAAPVRPRWRRRLAVSLAAVLVLALVATLGGGWYYADQIMERPHPIDGPRASVVSVQRAGTAATVRLRGPALAGEPEIIGISTPAGYLRLDVPLAPAASVGGQTEATRPAALLSGTWPQDGAVGELDTDAFPADDPAAALAGPLTHVGISGPLGPHPAWQVAANPDADGAAARADTWVVFVHGRGGSRAEGLRLLSVTSRLGYPALAITYRNDVGAPGSPDGRNHWGLTEWSDLQAAVTYLKGRGARRLVLAGASMGGAIVTIFLRRSPDAGMVAGTILDSPLLSMARVLDREADERRLGPPGAVLLPVAKAIADWRGDLDFAALEQPPATVATLLIHGTADGTVPVAGSDAYAAARPDLVTYLRVAGAGHVASWNLARTPYEDAVSRFMTDRAR